MRPNQASVALPLVADAPASPAKRRPGAAGSPSAKANPRRHRLHALAPDRQQKARHITAERRQTIRVTQSRAERIDVAPEMFMNRL